MKKTVMLIGNSQLAFFVAKQLEQQVGDLAHMEIIWLNTTEKIFPVAHQPFKPKGQLRFTKVTTTSIKGINANDGRIVTGRKIYHYDLLFIDQTAVYTAAEREKIFDQFETLISTLRSKENQGVAGKGKVLLLGNVADSLQLALELHSRKLRDSSAAIAGLRIEVEPDGSTELKRFFQENQIFYRKSQYPGLQIKPPLVVFASKKVRGLPVDLSGRAVLLSTGEPTNHQNVVMIDNQERSQQNLARPDWLLAKQIAANLVAKLDGTLEKPLDVSGQKLLLSADRQHFVSLGRMTSSRNRARVVVALEKRFWQKLLNA